jgi:hypothetical protein
MAQLVTLLLLLIAAGAAFFGTDNAIKALKGGDRPDTKSAAALNEVLSEASKRQVRSVDFTTAQQNATTQQLPVLAAPAANSNPQVTIIQTPVGIVTPSATTVVTAPVPAPTSTIIIQSQPSTTVGGTPTSAPTAAVTQVPAAVVVPPVTPAPVKGMW